MPKHQEQRELPFKPEQLFDLVADVERYPEFLPWCKAVRILERKDNQITANLVIGFKLFRDQFTSIVTLDRPESISVSYIAGPLAHLTNEWRFEKNNQGGCELFFDVDFDFRSPFLAGVMEIFFEKALARMASAFEARAFALYGESTKRDR